jgi:hypothetical protein
MKQRQQLAMIEIWAIIKYLNYQNNEENDMFWQVSRVFGIAKRRSLPRAAFLIAHNGSIAVLLKLIAQPAI